MYHLSFKISAMILFIGALDVVYGALMGNLGTLEVNTKQATQGSDFNSTTMTLRLEDGQQSTTILIPIIDVSGHNPFWI